MMFTQLRVMHARVSPLIGREGSRNGSCDFHCSWRSETNIQVGGGGGPQRNLARGDPDLTPVCVRQCRVQLSPSSTSAITVTWSVLSPAPFQMQTKRCCGLMLPTTYVVLTHTNRNCSIARVIPNNLHLAHAQCLVPVHAQVCHRLGQSVLHPTQLSYTSINGH